MDNKKLAKNITKDVIVELNARNILLNYHNKAQITALEKAIKERVLKKLNVHRSTQSFPTTCDEPGIAY